MEEYTLEELVFKAYELGLRQGKYDDLKTKVIIFKLIAIIELIKRGKFRLDKDG